MQKNRITAETHARIPADHLAKENTVNELLLTNAHIVTPLETLQGALLLRDGVVADIDTSHAAPGKHSRIQNMEGDYLLPGLVELHTDTLERQLTPRPGVLWPASMAAALAHDAVLASCGVLTVLDALCAEAFPREELQRRLFHAAVAAVTRGQQNGIFRAKHFLHLRCETCDPAVLELVTPYMDSPLLKLVSLMDHTPGQRQYRNLARYREYYSSEGWTDSEFQRVVSNRRELQRRHAATHRRRIIEFCRERALPLASHDDATPEHVLQAVAEGVRICEFPTTLEAARAAKESGLLVLMGAPNLMLGRSHAGNVTTLDVLRADALDILSSDYAPYSLLAALFRLRRMGRPLHEAVNMASATPAAALGLTDTGRLEPGRRADVLRVRLLHDETGESEEPMVLEAWKEGHSVMRTGRMV